MLRNTTVTPLPSQSIRHTSPESSASASAQAPVGQTSISHSKINGLSTKVLQEVGEIANTSIQNKEKIDRLVHLIHLANLNIQALEEKKPHSPTENTRKADLRKVISSTIQEEEAVKREISDLSIRIQPLEKKRQQLAQATARRAVDFQKHFITFETLKKDKEVLDADKSALIVKDQASQNDINTKKADIRWLKSKMGSIDALIKKALDSEIVKNYEEMLQATELLFERHNLQLPSENTVKELTRYLLEITDHSIEEQIKHLNRRHNIKTDVIFATSLTVLLGAGIAFLAKSIPTAIETYRIEQEDKNTRELIRLGQPIEASELIRFNERSAFVDAETRKIKNQFTALVVASFVLTCVPFLIEALLQRSLQKERRATRMISNNTPPRRTLKKEIADSVKSKEEELFKLAFGLARRANIKLIKSPLETISKEATRLVMEAEMRGETSINADAVDAGKISEYLSRFKSVLGRDIARLEKKLDNEINEYIIRQNNNGTSHDKNQLSNLSKKTDFVKKFMINHEEKKADEIADKAIFMNEFSKIFNGNNEESLATAFKHIIVTMAQDILDKLAAADAGSFGLGASSSSGSPSFVERIKDAKQAKLTLEKTLWQANAELEETDQENKNIKKYIQDVSKEIQAKNDGMSKAMESMKAIPLSQNQKEEFEMKLREAGIDTELRDEYAGRTDKKISHFKAQRMADEEKFSELLKTYDELCNRYSTLQKNRKEKEDELAKIEFLEADRSGEFQKIKKIQVNIKSHKKEIDSLESEEKNLLINIESMSSLREVLTLNAIRRVRDRHLAQSESDLENHARKNGYSSNYLSVGHFLKSCLDAHASLQQEITANGKAELYGHFAKSDMDVADGMNRHFQHRPISASVADFCVEGPDQDGKIKYLIDHIYGYVPRGPSRPQQKPQ